MSKTLSRILLILGVVASIISLVFSFANALKYSVDFQWSPAVAFWKGINPYDISISSERNNYIILTQDPNYLHALYILFYPFTNLSFNISKGIWAVLNIVFAILSIWVSKKFFQLTINEVLLVSIIFFCSTPFTNNIGNGQHSLAILLSVLLYWSSKHNLNKIISLFIIGLKYSFAPFYFLHAIAKNKIFIPIVIFLYLLSAFLFSYILKENFTLIGLIKPLSVAQNKTSYGVSDFYSLIKLFFNLPFYFTIGISLFLAVIIHLVFYQYENEFHISILSIASLLLFYHLIYDYVFLLPLLIQFIKNFDKMSIFVKLVLSTCLFYFFYFYKILFKLNLENHLYTKLFSTSILLFTFILLFTKFSKKKTVEVLIHH